MPKLNWASAKSCSAAARNQRTASASSFSTPPAGVVQNSQGFLGEGFTLFSPQPVQQRGRHRIFGYALTEFVKDAQTELRDGVALVSQGAPLGKCRLIIATVIGGNPVGEIRPGRPRKKNECHKRRYRRKFGVHPGPE